MLGCEKIGGGGGGALVFFFFIFIKIKKKKQEQNLLMNGAAPTSLPGLGERTPYPFTRRGPRTFSRHLRRQFAGPGGLLIGALLGKFFVYLYINIQRGAVKIFISFIYKNIKEAVGCPVHERLYLVKDQIKNLVEQAGVRFDVRPIPNWATPSSTRHEVVRG